MGVAALLFGIQAYAVWGFGIDDVAISYRYAKHLADGQGLSWNLEGPRVEGYSNFLWVLLLALGRLAGIDIETFAKAFGAAFALLSLILIAIISKKLWGETRFWWLPAVLVAIVPEWVAWSVSGLEIAAFGSLLLLGFLGVMEEGWQRVLWLSMAGVGLVLVRPEGIVMALVLCTAGGFAIDAERLVDRFRRVALPLSIVAVSFAGLVFFRIWYFGYPLPNTVYAKIAPTSGSWKQALHWLLLGIPFWACWFWFFRSEKHVHRVQRVALFTALVLILIQIVIVVPVNPVMHFLHRYMIAFLPLLFLAVPIAMQRIARTSTVAVITVGALALWCAQGWPAVMERIELDRHWHIIQQCVTGVLRNLPEKPTVAILDAGRVPYWTDINAIDVWGLCDTEMGHGNFSPERMLERRPEVYVMTVLVKQTQAGIALQPCLGLDMVMGAYDPFAQAYGLHKVCKTPDLPDVMAYDYAVLVNRDWAEKHGVTVREGRMSFSIPSESPATTEPETRRQ